MRRTLILCALAVALVLVLWKGQRLLGDAARPAAGIAAEASDVDRQVSATSQAGEIVSANAADTPVRSEAVVVRPGDEAARALATDGTLLVRTVLEGGAALADMEVVVMPSEPERLGAGILQVGTDSAGAVRVEHLDPVKFSVWSPLGPRTSATVIAGAEVQVELVFKNVVDVHGIVVDPEGAAVAGARVWVAGWRRDWLGSHLATRSGPDGRFEVRHVHGENSLGASAALFGPSQLSDLSLADTSSSPVELRLKLTAGGGDLTGRVTDRADNPVEGARVAAGESPGGWETRRDGSREEQWTARVALTDADGRYRLDGLSSGRMPLAVQAAGYALLASEVEVVAGETTVLDLALERGMSVGGIVRDEAGEPVERALVLALDEPFEDPFPRQGPTDRGAPFNRPGVRSGADGSFLLHELPAGQVHLYASKGTTYWDDGDFIGTVQETLSGGPDDTLEWNPVLTRGYEIRGRVTYADGAPIPYVFVSAIRPEDERRYTVSVEEDGRFAIPGLENRAYTVRVQVWDAPADGGELEREDVWPSEGELMLVASFSKTVADKGTVHATIADVANRVEGQGAILFAHDQGWYHPEQEDGVFSSRLPSGRYQARVVNGDDVVGVSEWFDLAAGEERHLGEVYTSPAGSLRVRVVRPADLSSSLVFVAVQTDYRPKQGGRKLLPDEDELTFEDLLEGPVEVQLGGNGTAFEKRRVEVRAGGPTEVEFRLKPAVSCSFEIASAQTEGFGRVALVITDSTGGVYNEVEWFERWGAELPFDTKLFVPVGRYTVAASTTSGLSARGELVVESLSATPSLRLQLQ